MNDANQISGVLCGQCSLDLTDNDGLPRQPCERCGSTTRSFVMTILETVTPRDSLTLKATRGGATGEHKYFIEEKSGWQLHHDTGEWRHIEQVVDRENDRYRKLVIGEDGTVHRDIDEPLSAHFGRGDAKNKK